MRKNYYIVMQGMFSESGRGDMFAVYSGKGKNAKCNFYNKKDAIKLFNKVKKDRKGWTFHGRLITTIEKHTDTATVKKYEIIDSFEC